MEKKSKRFEFRVDIAGFGETREQAWINAVVRLFSERDTEVGTELAEPFSLVSHMQTLPAITQEKVWSVPESIASHLPEAVRDWAVQDLIEAIEAARMELEQANSGGDT